MPARPLKTKFPILFVCLAASFLLGIGGVNLRAQEDDDSVFVEPAWAKSVMEQDDFEASFKKLDRLEKTHRDSYAVPLLRARIWGMKADEAAEDKERIAALQQEHRFLLRAKSLATGAQNAALRAEIETDISDSVRLLRDAGATPLASSAASTGTTAQPKAVHSQPTKSQPVKPKAKPTNTKKPAGAAPIATSQARATAVVKLPPLKKRPGYVIGRAIYPDGRPIPSFTVSVLGYDGQINLNAGATPSLGWGEGKNGRYAIRTLDTFLHKKPVAGLVTSVQLKTKISYRGQVYTMYLHPIDALRDGGGKGEFKGNSGPGVVRDFVLKISGVKPQWTLYNQDENNGPNDSGTFYGAQMTLIMGGEGNDAPLSSTAPNGSQLFVTLVPQGPLLDGSKGQTQVRKVNVGIAPYYFYLRNIPIGVYNVSAQLKTPSGEVWPLRSSLTRENYKSTTQVVFNPFPYDSVGGAEVASLNLAR